MTEEAVTTGIDLSAIEAEVSKLSNDQLAAELTKFRVRQKVQQKKHYNPEKMKAYQAKQREKFRQMKTKALETPATQKGFTNMWEQINAAADEQAEQQVLEAATAPDTDNE